LKENSKNKEFYKKKNCSNYRYRRLNKKISKKNNKDYQRLKNGKKKKNFCYWKGLKSGTYNL
jgi:hypothetical protein